MTFRNIHNWMGGDHTDKFFNDAFAVLSDPHLREDYLRAILAD